MYLRFVGWYALDEFIEKFLCLLTADRNRLRWVFSRFIGRETTPRACRQYILQISYWGWYPVILLYYKSNAESIRSRKRDNYQNNPQNKKDASRASYNADPNKAKETARKQYNNEKH